MPGCWSAQISDEQRSAVEEDEVATGVHDVLPLPMGMAREDRCEGAGLKTKKGSMAP